MSLTQVEVIIELTKHAKGWDGYDADPPSMVAAETALTFLHFIDLWQITDPIPSRLPVPRIGPSVVGGIGVTYRGTGSRRAYVEFYNEGGAYMVLTDRVQEPIISRILFNLHAMKSTAESIGLYLRA